MNDLKAIKNIEYEASIKRGKEQLARGMILVRRFLCFRNATRMRLIESRCVILYQVFSGRDVTFSRSHYFSRYYAESFDNVVFGA